MVVTYYSKFFRTGADRHNGILMHLPLLVAEKSTPSFGKPIIFTLLEVYKSIKSSANQLKVSPSQIWEVSRKKSLIRYG